MVETVLELLIHGFAFQEPVTIYEGDVGLFGSPADYLKFLRGILNYGKYEGGQLLKRETVELMLKDNLPKEIKPQIDQFENGGIIGYTGGLFDDMNNDRWGFGWFIESDENDTRPVNPVYWSGAANSYYTLDIEHKTAVVYFSNYFPGNDKEAYDFYKLFESETFRDINGK